LQDRPARQFQSTVCKVVTGWLGQAATPPAGLGILSSGTRHGQGAGCLGKVVRPVQPTKHAQIPCQRFPESPRFCRYFLGSPRFFSRCIERAHRDLLEGLSTGQKPGSKTIAVQWPIAGPGGTAGQTMRTILPRIAPASFSPMLPAAGHAQDRRHRHEDQGPPAHDHSLHHRPLPWTVPPVVCRLFFSMPSASAQQAANSLQFFLDRQAWRDSDCL